MNRRNFFALAGAIVAGLGLGTKTAPKRPAKPKAPAIACSMTATIHREFTVRYADADGTFHELRFRDGLLVSA